MIQRRRVVLVTADPLEGLCGHDIACQAGDVRQMSIPISPGVVYSAANLTTAASATTCTSTRVLLNPSDRTNAICRRISVGQSGDGRNQGER